MREPDLPFQKWYEGDFDRSTKLMDFELRCVYARVLQVMWANYGYLPDDDAICARRLGCNVRTWRAYRARLIDRFQLGVDRFIGPILTHSRVSKDRVEALETQAKNKARTAPATAASLAERRAKSAKAASVTSNVTSDPTEQRDAQRNAQRNDVVRAISRKPEPETETSPKGAVSGSPLPPPRDDVRADLGYRPAASSRGLEGRSPAVASAVRRSDWDQTPTPGPIGDTAFLRAYREAGGDLTRLPQTQGVPMREHQPEEDDHDERQQQQQPDQQPALAAHRSGDDDEPLDLGF